MTKSDSQGQGIKKKGNSVGKTSGVKRTEVDSVFERSSRRVSSRSPKGNGCKTLQ